MPRFQTPPLKRHHPLKPLSRDHYVGLAQSQHLMKAADGDATDRRAAIAEFLDAWEMHIAEHFNDEERLTGPLADEGDRTRLLDEHQQLRALAAEARKRRRQIDPDACWIRELGRLLNEHIRWEERALFPALESTAGEKLDLLRAQADQIEQSRRRAFEEPPRSGSSRKSDRSGNTACR